MKRKRSLSRWLVLGAALLAGAALLLLVDRSGRLLFRVIGLLGTAMFAFSILAMLLTFRRARRLSPRMLALTALVSPGCTLFFFSLTGSPLTAAAATVASGAGLAVGVGWSFSNLLFVDRELIQVRGTLWSLAVWALAIAIPQLFGVLGYRTPYSAALFSFFGMGLTVGNSLGLIRRYFSARELVLKRQRVRP